MSVTCAEKRVCRIKAQRIDFFPVLISWSHYLTHKIANQYHICIVIKAERKGRAGGFSLAASLYITHRLRKQLTPIAFPDKLRRCGRPPLIKVRLIRHRRGDSERFAFSGLRTFNILSECISLSSEISETSRFKVQSENYTAL